jgi:hypothetical protein
MESPDDRFRRPLRHPWTQDPQPTPQFTVPDLDYDVPFIPVVLVISPKKQAVGVAPAEPGTLLPGRQ